MDDADVVCLYVDVVLFEVQFEHTVVYKAELLLEMIVDCNKVFQCEELPRFEILIILYEKISDLVLAVLAIEIRIPEFLRRIR